MVGAKLKAWRLEQGDISQREAAKEAGISQAAWQELEAGITKRLGLDVAARVAIAVGIPLTDLISDPDLAKQAAKLMRRLRARMPATPVAKAS